MSCQTYFYSPKFNKKDKEPVEFESDVYELENQDQGKNNIISKNFNFI